MKIVGGAVNEAMFLKMCDGGALQNGDVGSECAKKRRWCWVNEAMFLKICDSGALQNGDARHKCKKLAMVLCQRKHVFETLR